MLFQKNKKKTKDKFGTEFFFKKKTKKTEAAVAIE